MLRSRAAMRGAFRKFGMGGYHDDLLSSGGDSKRQLCLGWVVEQQSIFGRQRVGGQDHQIKGKPPRLRLGHRTKGATIIAAHFTAQQVQPVAIVIGQ